MLPRYAELILNSDEPMFAQVLIEMEEWTQANALLQTSVARALGRIQRLDQVHMNKKENENKEEN